MSRSVLRKNSGGSHNNNSTKKTTVPVPKMKTTSIKLSDSRGLSLAGLSLKSKNETQSSVPEWPDLSSIWTNPKIATESLNVQSTNRKKRAPWSIMEDNLVSILVRDAGSSQVNWTKVASHVNEVNDGNRTGKQCRERWLNHLRPGIKKGDWTSEEEEMIRYYYQMFGPKWSTMAQVMKNRTDNDIKNKWNSMNRSARRAQDRLSKKSCPNDVILLQNSMQQIFEQSSWDEEGKTPPQFKANGTTVAVAAEIFRLRKFPSKFCVAQTVTDGASAHNSPISQKNYWETALEF